MGHRQPTYFESKIYFPTSVECDSVFPCDLFSVVEDVFVVVADCSKAFAVVAAIVKLLMLVVRLMKMCYYCLLFIRMCYAAFRIIAFIRFDCLIL